MIPLAAFQCNRNNSAKYADAFAHGLTTLHQTIDQVHSQRLVSDIEYQKLLSINLQLDEASLTLDKIIGTTGSTSQQIQSDVQNITNLLSQLPAVTTNQQAKLLIESAVTALNTTLTEVSTNASNK